MNKVKFIEPISKHNTLSSQLKKATNNEFSAKSFFSAHNPDGSPTPAGILTHKESGQSFFVPFSVDKNQAGLDCIKELARIVQNEQGVGGYQWGDTSGPDGNFGRETLDQLEVFGLVKRTGGRVNNQLGGVWPEVEVTEAGRAVVAGYLDWRRGQNMEMSR